MCQQWWWYLKRGAAAVVTSVPPAGPLPTDEPPGHHQPQLSLPPPAARSPPVSPPVSSPRHWQTFLLSVTSQHWPLPDTTCGVWLSLSRQPWWSRPYNWRTESTTTTTRLWCLKVGKLPVLSYHCWPSSFDIIMITLNPCQLLVVRSQSNLKSPAQYQEISELFQLAGLCLVV